MEGKDHSTILTNVENIIVKERKISKHKISNSRIHILYKPLATCISTFVLIALIASSLVMNVSIASAAETSVTASSGSASAIQAAINGLSSNGGTVYIPEGTFKLGGSVTVPSNIELIGAGVGVTVLNTSGSSKAINVSGNDIRVSGFSLINPSNSGGTGIQIDDSQGFRIDHLRIEGFGPVYQAAISVNGSCKVGVIDHNYISTPLNTKAYGVAVYGDGWWPHEGIDERDDFFGANFSTYQADALYIEDNTFVNTRHSVASNNGSYYVFRYNTINGGNNLTSSRIDAHGINQWDNGSRFYEIYGNTIGSPAPNSGSFAIQPRGGDGLIYDNKVTGYDIAVGLSLSESQSNSYPQDHQIHRCYVWDNTGASTEVAVTSWVPSSNAIKEGRDYFRYARPDYTAYTYPHPLVSGSSSVTDDPTITEDPTVAEDPTITDDPPVADADSNSTNQDTTPITDNLGVVDNDSDAEGDALSVVLFPALPTVPSTSTPMDQFSVPVLQL